MSANSNRVVIVDAVDACGPALDAFLEAQGFAATRVASSARALERCSDAAMVLAVLPTAPLTARDFMRELRTVSQVPIIVLHAAGGEEEALEALEHGADDYVCSDADWQAPDSLARRELLARIEASLRRVAPHQVSGQVVSGGLVLDLGTREASWRGETLPLTPRELELLRVLMELDGATATHEELLDRVWHGHADGRRHYLHVYVTRLRRRLAEAGTTVEIRNQSGVGYALQHTPEPAGGGEPGDDEPTDDEPTDDEATGR